MAHKNDPSDEQSGRVRRVSRSIDTSQLEMTTAGRDWGGVITLVSLVVIVISVGTIGYIQFASSLFPETPDHRKLAIFAGEPIAKARDYPRTGNIKGGWPDMNTVNLKVNQTSSGLDAIDSELHERCTKRISKNAALWSVERGKAVLRILEAPTFLACTMRHQRSRFCQPYYRERLAERISTYFKVHRSIQARWQQVMRGQNAVIASDRQRDIMNAMKELDRIERKANGFNSRKPKRSSTPRDPSEIPLMSRSFRKALSDLSNLGLIGPEDFTGLFSKPPKELKPLLISKPSPC